MKKIIVAAFFSLFFNASHGQQALYKILNEYLPYLPFEKKTDSLLTFYTSNKNFIADSVSPFYLKGDFKNFNPPDLKPSKVVIEIEMEKENSLDYTVRICLDSSATSRETLKTIVEKLYKRVSGFFAKNIGDESDRKDKYPFKTYNFYTTGNTFPTMLLGWGYNESAKFTGYYFAISLFTHVEQ